MPNIKQQKRRVSIAARQRDKDAVAAAHRELVRSLDRAAAARAIHPNRAARKKSQAARLVAGTS